MESRKRGGVIENMLKRSLLLLSLSFIFFNTALFAAGESGWIYVLNRNYNEISVIGPGEKRLIYHIPLGTAGTPIVLNRRGTRFYRSSPDGLAVVYAKTNRIIKNVTFPNGSMTWAFSPDFRYLWGIGLETEVVVVIDEKKARLVKTLDLAGRPQAPIFSADGKKVFLIDKAGVRVIDTRAYKQTKEIPFPNSIDSLAYDDNGLLWAGSSAGRALFAVDPPPPRKVWSG